MKPEDDPEARIRELERPLAETARASEMGSNQTPGSYPYTPGPSAPPTPPTYGVPFPGTTPRLPSRKRMGWLLAPFFGRCRGIPRSPITQTGIRAAGW